MLTLIQGNLMRLLTWLLIGMVILVMAGVLLAAPPTPVPTRMATYPQAIMVVHTCRMPGPVVILRPPPPPPPVIFPPAPLPAPLPPPPAPAPIFMTPPATAPATDPAVIALLQQILHNQTQILLQLNKPALAPAPGCLNGGPQVIVVPADGSGGPVVMPLPTPGTPPAITFPPSTTPGPLVLPPGAVPPFTLPPGAAPPIALPPGAAPPLVLPPGAAPPIKLPGGSAPPTPAPPSSVPVMPPAGDVGMLQRYTYMRYTVYVPAQRRYIYVFVPQTRSTFTPDKKR